MENSKIALKEIISPSLGKVNFSNLGIALIYKR